MLHLHRVASLDLPALAPYRTLRWPATHERAGIFVAEGPKVVHRLLERKLAVVSLLCSARWAEELRPALEQRAETVEVFVAADDAFEQLVGHHVFNKVLAIGRVPPPVTLDEAWHGAPAPRLWVAVDGVTNAENLGAILRNAAAFGAGAVVLGETTAPPWLRRTVRASMGAVFDLTLVRPPGLAATLLELRRRGARCVAADARGVQPLASADLAGDVCLVFGHEGDGLRPAVRTACELAVAIPMPPHVDSLNVASATAVFLYEAARQRNRSGTGGAD
jgi:tRNA G18 (ribose-2'-O)-methylase SpoU